MAQPARSDRKPEQESPASAPGAPQPPQKSIVREYAEALGIALVLAIIIRTFFVQAYKIPSGSMEPTLLVGDHILVNKIIYGFRMPDSLFGYQIIPGLPYGQYLFRLEPIHRNDVIVFVFPPDPTKDFIKRVIGLPGDTIQIKQGHVWLNGARMNDPHASYSVPDSERSLISPRDTFGPVKVPPYHLFVMGDNRDRSYDSRFWGFVDENAVEGRAMIIYWSWDSAEGGFLPLRWSRFFKVIH